MRELLKWKEYSSYGITYAGYLGKWRLCTIFFNSIDKNKDKYILNFFLPGLMERTYCNSVESAKDTATIIVTNWLVSALGNIEFCDFLREYYNISMGDFSTKANGQ